MDRDSDGHFFGYGSLVNGATHHHTNLRTATVRGWRRHWVQASERDIAFLSVVPDPFSAIQGMVADVAAQDWPALDLREKEYDRQILTPQELDWDAPVQMYRARPESIAQDTRGQMILLSYLDCVVQGFLEHFGRAGVANFFRTTSGWDTPIRNDREQPIYPRAQRLTAEETDIVNEAITNVNGVVVKG